MTLTKLDRERFQSDRFQSIDVAEMKETDNKDCWRNIVEAAKTYMAGIR